MRNPRIYHLSVQAELSEFIILLNEVREKQIRIVATNGCFDLIHSAHVRGLHQAAQEGNFLVVGINSDEGVSRLKGPTRPINREYDRAIVVEALACVDVVAIFPGTKATEFLQYTRPDVWVKGGDYDVSKLDPEERAAVIAGGGITKILPLHEGYSTTKMIEKINA